MTCEPSDLDAIRSRSNGRHLDAMSRVFSDVAEHGPDQALENLADYLNGCDAVGEGDPEIFIAAKARLESEQAEIERLRTELAAANRLSGEQITLAERACIERDAVQARIDAALAIANEPLVNGVFHDKVERMTVALEGTVSR